MAVSVEIKVILPKRLKSDEIARRGLLNPLRKFTTVIKKDFQATTKGWNHQPKFETKIGLTRLGPDASVSVSTTDERYGWINNGTPARTITPVRAPALRFPYQGPGVSYKAKTKRRVIGSGSHWQKLGPVQQFAAVNNPGIEPREFDIAIAEKEQKPFENMIKSELSKAANNAF